MTAHIVGESRYDSIDAQAAVLKQLLCRSSLRVERNRVRIRGLIGYRASPGIIPGFVSAVQTDARVG